MGRGHHSQQHIQGSETTGLGSLRQDTHVRAETEASDVPRAGLSLEQGKQRRGILLPSPACNWRA